MLFTYNYFPVVFIILYIGQEHVFSINNLETPQVKFRYRDHLMSQYDYPFLDFPYFTSVFSDLAKNSSIYNFVCSASLISFYWALTAASCMNVSMWNSSSYIIYAGIVPDPVVIIPEYPGEYLRGQWRSLTDLILHPNYSINVLPLNDIALLQVEVPFELNSHVNLIRPLAYSLMQECDLALQFRSCRLPVYENKTLEVNNKLMFLPVYLTEVQNCKINVDGDKVAAGYSHICSTTGIEVGNKGCLGSLGSPLICKKKQVGIMLDVFSCSESGNALYTRVDLYQEWIQTYITVGLWYTEVENSNFSCSNKQKVHKMFIFKNETTSVLLNVVFYYLFFLVTFINCCINVWI